MQKQWIVFLKEAYITWKWEMEGKEAEKKAKPHW